MPLLLGNTAASGASSPNYFGTSADGSVTYATNTSLIVPNKNGGYDGDMVVMNYSNLTIDSGVTLTTDQPCRGMLIYVSGNCTINGTLSMKGRGAYANPTVGGASDGNVVPSGGLQLPFRTESGSSSLTASAALLNGAGTAARTAISNHPTLASNGTVITLVRQGANGAPTTSTGSAPIAAIAGSNGTTGQSGGGGSGGGYYTTNAGGAGSYGSCFGGGSGGGGAHNSAYGTTGQAATAWGGPGGNGSTPDGGFSVPGGIGNGNGTWSSTNTLFGNNGTANTISGTGGLIILVVGGLLTVSPGGVITADGITGPLASTVNERGGGGASGGGNVVVAYKAALNNSGSITANGGSRWGWGDQLGGAGGNGSVQTLQIL